MSDCMIKKAVFRLSNKERVDAPQTENRNLQEEQGTMDSIIKADDTTNPRNNSLVEMKSKFSQMPVAFRDTDTGSDTGSSKLERTSEQGFNRSTNDESGNESKSCFRTRGFVSATIVKDVFDR